MILCVTGMHQSGGSPVAKLVERAGFSIGGRIMDAVEANPAGFVVDRDFVAFHEKALLSRQLDAFLKVPFEFQPCRDEVNAARDIIARRASRRDWAWHDPRTSIFLPFWDSLIPNCRYLILFRSPFDAVLSLIHRSDAKTAHIRHITELFACWRVYNESLLAFAKQKPDSVMLCNVDALVRDFRRFRKLFQDRFGRVFGVEDRVFYDIYRADELTSPVRESGLWPTVRDLPADCMRTYASLQGIADLPLPEHMDRSNATPARCIERRAQVSEQFESGYRKALMLLALLVDSGTALAALTRSQEDPENPELQEQAHFKTRVFNQAVSEIAETDLLRRRVETLISANAKLEEVRAQLAMTNRSLSEQLSKLETEREQFIKRLSDSEASNKALLAAFRGIYRRTARLDGEPDGETARDGEDWSGSIEEILKVPEHMLLDAAELRRKGNIADALKLAEQCAKACKRQGQFSGAYVAALYTTASILKETGDYSEAYRRFASLTRLRKAKPPAQFLGGAFFHMAELREKEGQREQAVRLLRRCLKVFPDHAEACRMLQLLRELSRLGS